MQILDNSTPEKAEKNRKFFEAFGKLFVLFVLLLCGVIFHELEYKGFASFRGYGAFFGFFVGSVILVGRDGWTKTAYWAWFKDFKDWRKALKTLAIYTLLGLLMGFYMFKWQIIVMTPNGLMSDLQYYRIP